MMKFVFLGRGSMVLRREIADTLNALSPECEPGNEFQRGYVAERPSVGAVAILALIVALGVIERTER